MKSRRTMFPRNIWIRIKCLRSAGLSAAGSSGQWGQALTSELARTAQTRATVQLRKRRKVSLVAGLWGL